MLIMKALIVEDEPKIAAALKRGLSQERYTVDVYDDGELGLAAALSNEYDVIILDRMLPSIGGLGVCRRIRQAKITTPIIMLTAMSQIKDRIEGLDAGADDYLVKPFSFEELLARIRALLRRPADTTDNILQVGDLTLDTVSYEVRRAQKLVKLTSTEFALLEYLMRNSGHLLSKDKIISHVWDFDSDVLPNTVEAYIGALRRKIDRPFKSKALIKTERGFGYKIE